MHASVFRFGDSECYRQWYRSASIALGGARELESASTPGMSATGGVAEGDRAAHAQLPEPDDGEGSLDRPLPARMKRTCSERLSV